jgi:hypothetical protein
MFLEPQLIKIWISKARTQAAAMVAQILAEMSTYGPSQIDEHLEQLIRSEQIKYISNILLELILYLSITITVIHIMKMLDRSADIGLEACCCRVGC